MSPDVHNAALRAAARLAFSVAFIAGCSSPSEDTTASEQNLDENTTGNASNDNGSPFQHHDTPECAAKLHEELPNYDDWDFRQIALSHEAAICCHDRLMSSGYDTQCCMAFDKTDPESNGIQQGTGHACTPWGPPVPPSMNRVKTGAARMVA